MKTEYIDGTRVLRIDGSARSEADVQALLRLNPGDGVKVWRNNVGAMRDAAGRVVRYGLANDSYQMSAVLKSSDLIGWRKIVITPDMVGETIAQFVSYECKAAGWPALLSTERERAQAAWLRLVSEAGGDAAFISA